MAYQQEVPQPLYRLSRPFSRFSPITFEENGCPGVRLGHALRNELHGLRYSEINPLLANTATKITLRINWPGYLPWCDVIHVYNFAYKSRPITLARLAHLVARKIKLCLECLSTEANRARATNPCWLVHNIKFEDLMLVQLLHVAKGSWQPVIVYSPRPVAG
ncbi:hypothetical protein BC835DRAFT_886736 [Cytidiella melzeri]|nr:hypothetical protein BC835DRAFT_886736 [Cytidiella melzeri]